MIKKITMCIKNSLIERLEHIIPGYLAHCEDCGHLKRVIFLKNTQRFLCRDCIDRYVKLYVKMNKIGTDREKNWHNGHIGQVV